MIPIIPESHKNWVGGPPNSYRFPKIRPFKRDVEFLRGYMVLDFWKLGVPCRGFSL